MEWTDLHRREIRALRTDSWWFRNLRVSQWQSGSNLDRESGRRVFDVITFFTPTNHHVIYYNKGKRTIRVFRAADGQLIADMRCPAKVRQACATQDGKALVVGYEDGAVQMFLIADRFEPTSVTHLIQWRKEQIAMKEQQMEEEFADKQFELVDL